MPDINNIVLAGIPKTSVGSFKNKKFDKNSQLKNASKNNRIPVIIDAETPVEQSVYTQQDTRQVYVTQAHSNAVGNVYEVLIARYEEGVYSVNDPDGSLIVSLLWVDVKHVTCGSLADAVVVVEGDQPAQTEPAAVTTAAEGDNRILESFIFFDHYMNGVNDSEQHAKTLERAIGIQREVAKFMGLYNGKTSISEKQQAKIDKQVHLVPFSDLSKDIDINDSNNRPIKINPDPGINAEKNLFYSYWNTHVATSKVHIVILYGHAGHDGIAMRDSGSVALKMGELSNLTIPPIDYILLLGCNLGDVSYKSNFASTIASLTQGGNPVEQAQAFLDKVSGKEKLFKTYLTAVVAADGNTSASVTKTDNFITGIKYNNGKYAPGATPKYTHYIEGKGFCIFKKGAKMDDVVIIPETPATPIKRENEKGYDLDWTEHPISVEEMLKEAQKIIQQ